MDLSDNLTITQKGADEIKNRTYKLSMKKRSVLILLETPRSVEHIIKKSVFPLDEIVAEIQALVHDGFISAGRITSLAANATTSVENFHLHDDVILPEAKFLLIDFCTDHFGSRSQAFATEIRACTSAKHLSHCLVNIFATAKTHCPDRIQVLRNLIKEIRDTL